MWFLPPPFRNYPNSWKVDPSPAIGMSLATQGLKENNMRTKLRRPESRRRPRTKVSWPVIVEVGDRVLHGETVDVSQFGVKVRLAERLQDATLAKLHITPSEGCPVDAQAIVWRMDEDGPVFLFLKKAPSVLVEDTGKDAAAARVLTILVVDDDEGVSSFARDTLGSAGYLVRSTADPVEAIRMAKDLESDIDLLLVDVVMPLMDGRELARRVVELRPKIKVLLMSGYEMAALKGAKWPFIAKPFGVTELIEKIEECTTTKRRPSVFAVPQRSPRRSFERATSPSTP
jgi:CheY-like chemotaxis protein